MASSEICSQVDQISWGLTIEPVSEPKNISVEFVPESAMCFPVEVKKQEEPSRKNVLFGAAIAFTGIVVAAKFPEVEKVGLAMGAAGDLLAYYGKKRFLAWQNRQGITASQP